MPSAPLDAIRAARQKLRWLKAVVPVVLFFAPLGAGGALAAASHTKSPVLIALAATAFVVSIAVPSVWLLTADRRARKPPSDVPWSEDAWRRFERSFWAHVNRRSDLPPPPRTDRDEV